MSERDREMSSLFGTDGIRDRAGEGLLSAESVAAIGRALGEVLERREEFPEDIPRDRGEQVFIARDTRASGGWLLDSLCRALGPAGIPVVDLGVLPTPGAAYCAAVASECCLAVVLSASHNPAEYNGVKLLSAAGRKASDRLERAVTEAYFRARRRGETLPAAAAVREDRGEWAAAAYTDFLADRSWNPARLEGRKVVLDLANGAACQVAPRVFATLGMEVECIGERPDGANINVGCGALEPAALAARVVKSGAVAGFSFDGDGDRMIPVTGAGTILDGDFVLALAGPRYRRLGRLRGDTVVATVMSNLGLEKALAREGISLRRTPVGDRHVFSLLEKEGYSLGGEQSGHLIFMDDLHTGDGILAAIRLLDVLESDALDLEGESRIMRRYPQVLRNVRVRQRVPLAALPEVARAVEAAGASLGDEGRVVLRYSGTEPLARVMVEGPEETLVERLAGAICRAIERSAAS